MENEMVIAQARELAKAENPEQFLNRASEIARAIKKMIDSTNSKIKIGQGEHVKSEGWQTVGALFHTSAVTRSVEPCEIHGVKGARAIVELVDEAGQVVGRGESYCMWDEANWKGKPWAQIASMSQTRAGSKAYSNKYKWIIVLAGYKPTPAEEMDGVIPFKETENDAIEPYEAPQRQPSYSLRKISEKQIGRLHAIYRAAGKSEAQAREYIQGAPYGYEHFSDILMSDYENICKWAEIK